MKKTTPVAAEPNSYETISQLLSGTCASDLRGYARDIYKYTECGAWVQFLTMKGTVNGCDVTNYQNTPQWWTRYVVGIRLGTIVEGSNAEFTGDPLYFPFDARQLSDAIQACEDFADENFNL